MIEQLKERMTLEMHIDGQNMQDAVSRAIDNEIERGIDLLTVDPSLVVERMANRIEDCMAYSGEPLNSILNSFGLAEFRGDVRTALTKAQRFCAERVL